MKIEGLLIQPGDLPDWNVAGEFKILTGDQPILHNVGDAEFFAIQWIGNIESRAEIAGEIRLFGYQTNVLAEQFFTRLTRDFEGSIALESVGDRALIRHGARLFPIVEHTSVRFLRNQFVVDIRGFSSDDPSFGRSKLTRELLVRYAQRLDQRLIVNEVHF